MTITRDYKKLKLSELTPYEKNNKKHGDNINEIVKSIQANTYISPIVVDENNVILAGHGRKLALDKLGVETADVLVIKGLSEKQKRDFRLRDNKLTELSEWDLENIKFELEEIDDEELTALFPEIDLDKIELNEEEEDEVPTIPEEIFVQEGDIFQLGDHRIMCGDSTDDDDIQKLTQGNKIDLGFNDPPYGMKLESKGVNNDNLNYEDLLEFNEKRITKQVDILKDNGSIYIRGIDEPLMDMHAFIFKPLIKQQKATFRNLITWNKGNGQGQNSELTRSYAIADEKCLFYMMGVQGFNNNSDNYFEGREPIRLYLSQEMEKLGERKDWRKILGTQMGSHYFTKSQRILPTREVYEGLQQKGKEYNAFKKEYDEIKKEYDEIKKEYYNTRAYFNNTRDNFNNVWNIDRTGNDEREQAGGHYTPKPLKLCERGIMSSTPDGGSVVDFFLGSGSTLIACEKTKRTCYGMELDPKYIQVIIKRYHNYTNGNKEIKCLNRDLDINDILNE